MSAEDKRRDRVSFAYGATGRKIPDLLPVLKGTVEALRLLMEEAKNKGFVLGERRLHEAEAAIAIIEDPTPCEN